MKTIYEMPGHLIRRAHQISTAIFAEECMAFDVTAIQYSALCAIGMHESLDATRLSRLIAFDRATIGGVLERMEAKGWIERVSSPKDRRVKLLRLTPEGENLVERVESAVQRAQKRLLEPLAAEDRKEFLRLLSQLAQVHNDITSAPIQPID
ncbi:MarR family transcriptional regulator [Sinorhizobium sp. BG8]|uniref:MarR family winged helix-turn-helix transcriptional regulator n=1 Tax=Sinorhizobium sp. BG8 TaxID=2613773 RepID=UPI00193CA90B|nr:MarR family transcriptional regulator [Sinorhizobium sp. BG8]QRM57251.1 MarR family transcriptional regulator [Sinorhizobium sp. BG8]